MSQHIFETVVDDKTIRVLSGWDKPLQQYYCVIFSEGEIEPIYSNLYEMEPHGIDYYIEKCSQFGVTLPSAMINEIKADCRNNVVNRVETWS